MTEQNEIMQEVAQEVNANLETGEITPNEQVVQETSEYKIVKLPNGKYQKKMKYDTYFSRKAETEEEKIELYNVFNDSDSGLVTPLSNMVDKEIAVKNIFIQPYQSFDEDTGTVTDGVTTTIEDVNGEYYATSSKSVYHSIHSIMQAFNYPHEESYKPVLVQVTGTRRQYGVQIDLKLIGHA